ncbi:MAG: DUF2953 domain-containing protein [Candidatus Latescibacterota bacterium]
MAEQLLWGMAALTLALLLVPVALRVQLDCAAAAAPGVEVRLSAGGIGGLVGLGVVCCHGECSVRPLVAGWLLPFPRLRVHGRSRPAAPGPAAPPPAPEAPAEPAPSAPPSASPRWGRTQALLRWTWEPGGQFLRSLPRLLRLRRLHLQGRFGCEDPALTGRAYGWLQALRGLPTRRLEVEVFPDFVHQGFAGRVRLGARLHLGLLVVLALRLALQLAWRWPGYRRTTRPAAPAYDP